MVNRVILIGSLAMLFILSAPSGFSQVPAGNDNFIHPVPGFSNHPLEYPWAGGLNSCQFCAIDLDLDGTDDLLLFDRHGNRPLTFINKGISDSIGYTFSPGYAAKLPAMHDWVITLDYNCDGRMDIFTYGNGSVRVFENISDTSLKFRLVTDMLESFYYTGKVGILVTDVDYPAIADIDGDGDPDLLTFFGLGSYVEYHRNLSMEKYGNCDSLDFKLETSCWGKFKESEGGNRITLNEPCQFEQLKIKNYESQNKEGGKPNVAPENGCRQSRHTGSTLLATDLNGDGLMDLIIGDVDYPGLDALTNGGTIDTAFITTQDTAFPAGTRAVRLFSFPAVSRIDLDNDGLKDMVVSPFDPALFTSDNYNCTWFYKNTGTASLPRYEFRSERLFRDEMMDFGSVSHPVLYDLDGDGLLDLFVGNEGLYDSSYYKDGMLHSVYTATISYFRNTGTATAPVFTYITGDLAGISSLRLRGVYPALGDLNGDDLPDLLAGSSDGTLVFFPGTGMNGDIPEFGAPVMNYMNIDVGDYSAPQLFDLDKDGKTDLVIGEQDGNLNWYKNTGTGGNPAFTLVTSKLGKVNVTNYALSYKGFSTPCFSTLPGGKTFLVVGSDEGRIHLFTNIDNNLSGSFTDTAGIYTWLSATPGDTLFGWQTSPAIGHLTDASGFDLITGNFSGGLNYITRRSPGLIVPGMKEQKERDSGILSVYPNPADDVVTIEGGGIRDTGCRMEVFNLFGRKILDSAFPGKISLPTTSLPEGIYLVRCEGSTGKLVVVHH